MLDAFSLLVPVPVLGVVAFAILVLGSVFFVPRQRARGFEMLTVGKVVLTAAIASVLASVVQFMVEPHATLSHLLTLTAAASVIYLLGISMVTDFSIHKIPTESAWLPAFVGVPAFVLMLLSGVGVAWSIDRIFVVVILAILPLVAFISVLVGGGGAADFRVAMASFLATAWWVEASTLLLGLGLFLVFTLVGRFLFSKPSPKGRRMTPAGPAYVSLYAGMALLSLAFS